MESEEVAQQDALHKMIEESLDLPEGELLTGWIVIHESASANGPGNCGHIYGPREMTTWRALGLVEWVRRFSLHPGDDDDEEDD